MNFASVTSPSQGVAPCSDRKWRRVQTGRGARNRRVSDSCAAVSDRVIATRRPLMYTGCIVYIIPDRSLLYSANQAAKPRSRDLLNLWEPLLSPPSPPRYISMRLSTCRGLLSQSGSLLPRPLPSVLHQGELFHTPSLEAGPAGRKLS